MSPKKTQSKPTIIGIKDTEGMREELAKIAKREHLNVSQVIRRALRRELGWEKN